MIICSTHITLFNTLPCPQLTIQWYSMNRAPKETKRYCFDNAPEGCSLVLIGRREQPREIVTSKLMYNKGQFHLILYEYYPVFFFSYAVMSVATPDMLERRVETSPKTVLSSCEDKSSSTEEDSSSTTESCITESPLSHLSKEQPNNKKQMSPLQRISSFLRTPFALSGRKRIEAFVDKEKPQPLLRCFSYEEIAKATNSFHPGNFPHYVIHSCSKDQEEINAMLMIF